MARFQVGRGASSQVELTQAQENQAQKLAQSIVEKGGIALFGEDRSLPLIRRAQFISQDIRKRRAVVGLSALKVQQKREREIISKLPPGVFFKQDPRTGKLTPVDVRTGKPPKPTPGIFLKPGEAERFGIPTTEQRLITRAEEFVGVKDSGVIFAEPGELPKVQGLKGIIGTKFFPEFRERVLELESRLQEFLDKKKLKKIGSTEAEIKEVIKEFKTGKTIVQKNGKTFFIDVDGSLKVKPSLPFGIEEVLQLTPEISFGEKFTPFAPPNFLSRQFVDSKAGKETLKFIEKINPELALFLKLPAPKVAFDIVTLLQLGFFFDPAFEVGAIKKGAKTKQVQKQVKKTSTKAKEQSKKVDIDNVVAELRFKIQGKTLRDKTGFEKVTDARRIFNEIKKTKDPKLQAEQFKNLKSLLREAHGEKGGNLVLQDLLAQEGITLTKIRTAVQKPPKIQKVFQIEKVPKIKGAGQITTTGKAFSNQRVQNQQVKNQERINFSKTS